MMTRRRSMLLLALVCAAIAMLLAITPRFAVRGQEIARSVGFDPNLLIAFVSNRDGDEDIYVVPWDGWEGWETPITPLNRTTDDDGARDWNPAWSPDGARIVFNSDRSGVDRIYVMNADGTGLRPLFSVGESIDLAPAWSPDGGRIAFISDRAGIGRDLFVANADGTDVQQITTSRTIKGDPAWTPDGTSLTYWERQTTGVLQVVTAPIDAPTRTRPQSFSGGASGMAFWSADGARLFYESNRDGGFFRLYSADAQGNAARALTDAGTHSGRATISPDGSLIVFTTDRDQSDELYLMNADGSGVERLTDNAWSDHSPVWQPAVPPNAQPIVEPTPDPIMQPTAAPSGGAVVGALGQSAGTGYGFDIYPIDLQTLRDVYGITAWHQAGWRGQGRRIGVIDLGFGGLFAFENGIGRNITLPLQDDRRDYDVDANDHGRRVLEIIHAIAPDAELFACKYDGSFSGFQRCKDFLAQDQQVNVINHSAGLPIFPLDGRNDWAREASDANDLNVLWINSAGNFQRGFYSADFSDLDGDGLHEFAGGSQPVETLEFDITAPYRGNVILTWEQEENGFPRDLDLEIVNRAGTVVASSTVRQASAQPDDSAAQPAEALLLDINEPFAVRVRAPQGMFGVVRLVLVIEYLSIDENVISNVFRDRTSIAPGDSVRVVTVGAVQTIEQAGGAGAVRLEDQLAPYSSYGLIGDARYNKPNLLAYGDLRMSDGAPFFGTSAAAPVVAGAMALFWSANESLNTGQLRQRFDQEAVYLPENYTVVTHGSGVMRLPQPPARFAGQASGVALAKLVFPQPEVTEVIAAVPQCGGVPTRFSVGLEGYVTYNLGLFLRAEPGTSSQRIGPPSGLQLGEQFVVLDGPACGGSTSWWNVQLNDGSTGWLAEGEDYYLTAPSNYVSAELPLTYDTFCPNAPEIEVAIGDRVVIQNAPAGGLTLWRRPTRLDVIGGMEEGAELHILGGPVCDDERAIRRWYVRVVDGRWEGSEGWTSEARPTERWLARRDAGDS